MSKAEQKAQILSKEEQLKAQIDAIKQNRELMNALIADSSLNLSDLKSEYLIEINNCSDIHFKKAMLQSLAHFANLHKLQKLKMRYEKDRIIIESAK